MIRPPPGSTRQAPLFPYPTLFRPQIQRLTRAIEDALANRQKLLPKLEARALPRARAEAFRVAPRVFVDNNASNRFTVVEVNAQDRPALLNQLAYALFQSKVTVHSAHVANYGERDRKPKRLNSSS